MNRAPPRSRIRGRGRIAPPPVPEPAPPPKRSWFGPALLGGLLLLALGLGLGSRGPAWLLARFSRTEGPGPLTPPGTLLLPPRTPTALPSRETRPSSSPATPPQRRAAASIEPPSSPKPSQSPSAPVPPEAPSTTPIPPTPALPPTAPSSMAHPGEPTPDEEPAPELPDPGAPDPETREPGGPGWDLGTRLARVGRAAGELLARGKQVLRNGLARLEEEDPTPEPPPGDLSGEIPEPGTPAPSPPLEDDTGEDPEDPFLAPDQAPANPEVPETAPPNRRAHRDLLLPVVIPEIGEETPLSPPDPWSTPGASPEVVDRDGLTLVSPAGLRMDLDPGSRFLRGPEGLTVLSGGGLVWFPPGGALLRLPEGRSLEAREALCELQSVEANGVVDLLGPEVTVHEASGIRQQVQPFQRWFLEEGLATPMPRAEASLLLRRLAWFRAGTRRCRAPVLARQLARRALLRVRGTAREGAAREALRAAENWVSRVARRYRDEALARL